MNYEELALKLGVAAEKIAESVEAARRSTLPVRKRISVIEKGKEARLTVTREGVGPLNTDFGDFHHFNFRIDDRWEKYSVIVKGDVSADFAPIFKNGSQLLLRTDSGCETGQLFGDKTCECLDQLQLALEVIAQHGEGIIINIPRQDGRGLGLPFKLATLRLQDELGVDTVVAPALLDPSADRDTRTYSGVIAILKYFGIPTSTRIILASNNPKKFAIFQENGWQVPAREEVVIEPTANTQRHLAAKEEHLDHIGLTDKAGTPPSAKSGKTSVDRLELLREVIDRKQSNVCCGIDPDLSRLPNEFSRLTPSAQVRRFTDTLIALTKDHVSGYKIQKAFFDVLPDGRSVLHGVIKRIRSVAPDTFVILDCKVGDIDNTMSAYATAYFDGLKVDALVLNPYMGSDVWQVLDNRPDKVGVVLVRTSNAAGSHLQDATLADGRPVWKLVMDSVIQGWHKRPNLMPVFATTVGMELTDLNDLLPESMPVLLAGVGAQGGSPPDLRQLRNAALVNSSRGIAFPYERNDPRWRDAISHSVMQLKTQLRGATDV